MDTLAVIQRLEQHGLVRTHRITGKYMTCYCPIHNSGTERKPSFGILLEDQYRNRKLYPAGWSHCFSCQFQGTLPELVTAILKDRKLGTDGLEWLAQNVPEFELTVQDDSLIPSDMMNNLNSKFAVNYLQEISAQKAKTYIPEEELAGYRYTVPYMYERKLTDPIIELFDIGVDMNWVPPGRKKPVPCLTFPVHDKQGRVEFIYRRSIEGKFFNAPEGVEKPVYGLYQLPKGCQSLLICESIINALTAWSYGYPAVALLGTGNALQMQQLKELGVREFIICMDGDDAGKRATKKLKNALRKTALIYSINMIDGEDVNSITQEQFQKLYNERE